jgi:ATP synthase protein I
MEDKEKLPSLEELESRIEHARPHDKKETENKAPDPMRVGLELAAGVFVGGFLGYYLDKWLGTRPILLIVLLLLGAAAGFRNLYRMVDTAPETKENKK